MIRLLGSVAFACAGVAPAFAQCPQYTPIFNGGGFDADPYAMHRFDDGAGERLFVGGAFRVAGAAIAKHVAAWDGTSWSPVGGGTNDTVRALAEYDDGSGPALYAGGDFLLAEGQAVNRVARWNGINWSGLGIGVNGTVNALISFDDGGGMKLYAAGKFTQAGGALASRVARWDGVSWAPVGAGLNNEVRVFAIHDDGTGPALYAAGAFTGWVARWDGAAWQAIGGGLGPGPETLALISYDAGPGARWLFAGGKSLMSGYNAAARWDGVSWQAMLPVAGLTKLESFEVRNEPAGLTLYAGGGIDVGFVKRWTPAAGWTNTGIQSGGGIVRTMGVYDDQSGHGDELYIGGPFVCIGAGTIDAHHVARFDGSTWRAVQVSSSHSFRAPCCGNCADVPIAYPELRALARWRDPADGRFKVVAGGWLFSTTDDSSVEGLAVWDGVKWSRFPGNYYTSFVDALISWIDPITSRDVLVGSWIATPASGPYGISQYDGVAWSPLGSAGPQGQVRVFASFQEPGANFEALFVGFQSGPPIKRWDGVSWTTVGSGLSGACEALAVFDPPGALGPGLYAAGSIAGGVQRWDGTQWSGLGSHPGLQYPTALAVFDDGAGPNLFVGTEQWLWRWDGSTWTNYLTGHPLAGRALEVFDDGSGPALYMAAGRRFRNGQVQTYASGGPASYYVDLLAFEDENGGSKALWIAGEFDFAGGVPSRGIARWSDPCATLTTYCTAKTNSQGCTPSIGWTGQPSLALSATTPFTITASNVINQKGGLLYYGVFGRSAVPFQGGFKCVPFPALRTPPRSSGGNIGPDDCSGVYAIDFTPWINGSNDELLAIGITVAAQWWSRDPASPSTTGLTNAIEFEIRP